MGIDHESIKLHLKELRDCIDKLKPISKQTKEDFIKFGQHILSFIEK